MRAGQKGVPARQDGPVTPETQSANQRRSRHTLASFIFLSRWLQAPLYVGLIMAQAVYVYRFLVELKHLIGFALLNHPVPASILNGAPPGSVPTETVVMLSVLGLIDVVMIANLLIMVIVGGYETFVSRLRLQGHPDQPEWLSHVGISSVHLLKTFISPASNNNTTMWQVIIHLTFVVSALILAWIDRLTYRPEESHRAAPVFSGRRQKHGRGGGFDGPEHDRGDRNDRSHRSEHAR
jgi:uncharacterized membrane protein YqhA